MPGNKGAPRMLDSHKFQQCFADVASEHTGSKQQRQALLYADLKKIAHRVCRAIKPGETLQTTALLHETWIRLNGFSPGAMDSETEFLELAATVMHRIAVDCVRRRLSLKRGGGQVHCTFEDAWHRAREGEPDDLILQLDEGLEALKSFAPELAELVQLVFFAGLTQAEIAQYRGVSERTIRRSWRKAQAFLYHYLSPDQSEG